VTDKEKRERVWVLDAPKLWHVVLCGMLALGLMLTLPGPIWRGALLALAVAALLETAQAFIPSRQAGLVDFLFSGLGVACATLGFKWLRETKAWLSFK
jgi:VanZ family protein